MMPDRLLPKCRFVVSRVWRIDRGGTVTWLFLIALTAASGIAAFSEYRAMRHVQNASAQFREAGSSAASNWRSDASVKPLLKAFHSHELLDALNGASVALGLPINEMVFRFDDNPTRPYLRYSATVKLFGGYPAVRKFIDAMRDRVPETSLDAISCARTDIRSVHVSCELTVSAFYRRDTPHA